MFYLKLLNVWVRDFGSLWFLLFFSFFFSENISAQLVDGDLSMSIIAAPNLIVDSNVESPSTYAPEAVHFGVEICNNGANDMTDVYINIGDYSAFPVAPGTYRSRTVSESTYGGTFSLTHSGSTLDATRYVKTLLAGECVVQYWLVEYPRMDGSGNSVTGGSKPDDDLFLEYDIWANADDGGTSLSVDGTGTANMRNEISAMANKIYPNGTSKVPDEYLDAIQDLLGWRPETGGSLGSTIRLEGIWFDLGRINKGFDNNGDFIPDYNVFLQPIGDPASYNADCFRFVKSYGLIIVKKNDGTEELIPFVDQMYFENLPQNNNGAVGLVYYEFVPTNGSCSSNLTPYQEVASGSDNEKFNGDYGAFIPSLPSSNINATLDDTGVATSPVNTNVTFNLTMTNSSGEDIGLLEYGMPVVMETDIPSGTDYVAGSAASNNTLPVGITATILYSRDDGASWNKTEPVMASEVTNIQWWMSDVIADTEVVDVSFTSTIPSGYAGSTVANIGNVKLGGSAPFLEDNHVVLIEGNNSIGGTIFEDNGGTTGIEANATQDGDEGIIQSVNVSLYLDTDDDGRGDVFISTVATDLSGNYSFNLLPDGNYVTVVETDLSGKTCNGGACSGWNLNTDNNVAIDLDAANASGTGITITDGDFGFIPALSIVKTCNDGSIVYEDDLISYNISLTNNSYNSNPTVISAWGATDAGGSDFDGFANALSLSGPDGVYATKSYQASGNFNVNASGFDFENYTCPISSVEAVFQIYLNTSLTNDVATVEITAGGTTYPVSTFTTNELNAFVGEGNIGEIKLDIFSLRAWTWADFQSGFSVKFSTDKQNEGDAVVIYLDAIGIKINDGNTGDCISERAYDDSALLNSIPLVDTYDSAELEYISASIEPDVVAEGNLTWNNVMSLTPGETGLVTVYFKPLTPTATATNNVSVTGATFLDGTPANDDTDTYDIQILNTGSISGSIWNDASGLTAGWSGVSGYEGTDSLLLGVTMNLYACVDATTFEIINAGATTNKICTAPQNGGVWQLAGVTQTDAIGNYSFDGLKDGYYYAEVDNTTIPGTITQSGDPDETGTTCSTCDNLWNTPSETLANVGNISSGNDIANISFGYYANPAIEGIIWEDNNNNGIQDDGENGISGITVELQDGICLPSSTCSTTTSDVNGNYSFVNQPTGNYTVKVLTSSFVGTWTQTAESDATVDNSVSETLVGGEISSGNSFGFYQSGSSSISDAVYFDWDGDGIQDAGENGIAGVTVNIYQDTNSDGEIDPATDGIVGTTTTTSTGYNFSNIPAGSYIVEVDESTLPSFLNQTGDPDEGAVVCSVCNAIGLVISDGTSTYNAVDFGYQTLGGATITSTVWQDTNGDSLLVGESIIENVTVELWADTDGNGTYELAMTTISDLSGDYTFENLPNGEYQVKVSINDTDIPKDAFGNPSSSTNGSSYDVIISDGDVSSINSEACTNCSDDLDFGFAKLGAIGNIVYSDANGNGSQDWTETGIEGVTVFLCDAASPNCNVGSAIATDITDTTGNYLFTGLEPGNYTVAVESSGLGAQTADPNRDGETCLSTTYPGLPACDDEMAGITLSYSTSFMGASFGYQASGVIGDFIWLDSNSDGIQDDGEPGIGDVTVTLTNATAVTISGTPYAIGAYVSVVKTDLDGYYTYSDLPDGTYDIAVTTPIDRVITSDGDLVEDGTVEVVILGGETNITNGCSGCPQDIDFGFKLNGTSSLAGKICTDTDADGSCTTGGETQLEGISVFLYSSTGTFLGETLTNVTGDYSFVNLPADTYTISVGTNANPFKLSTITTAGTTTTTSSVYQLVVLPAVNSTTDIDFGFEYTVDIDFGDLPSTYDVTKLSDGGAYHIVPNSPTLYLGTVVDSEAAPIQNSTAIGDATDDGVTFNNPDGWVEGTNGGSYDATVAGTGWLVSWFDFNQDGDITDSGEMITSQAITTGTSTINFDIPIGANLTGTTYSRIRLFETEPAFAQFSYAGEATNGEVEDYSIAFSALPVELINFEGKIKDCNVQLTWTTESEKDFDYFEVQWSGDGHVFTRIGFEKSTGSANGDNYSFEDKTPSQNSYYRLKMVDLDGSTNYSTILFLKLDCKQLENQLNIFPNPISPHGESLTVELFTEKTETQILVVDVFGRTVKRISLEVIPGMINDIQIDISNLASGTYSLQHVGSNKSKLFIIQE